jgi:hypothetical protein
VRTDGTRPAYSKRMKRSLVRLSVAVLGCVASLLELVTRLVQLAIAVVARVTRRLESEKQQRIVVEAPRATVTTDEKLVGALTGLGFRAGPVRAFAATVRTRIGVEPIEGLVREGIVQLSETRQERRS